MPPPSAVRTSRAKGSIKSMSSNKGSNSVEKSPIDRDRLYLVTV